MMWRILLLFLPATALADSLIATRVIRAQETIAADAVTLVDAQIDGAVEDPNLAIGQETRVAIYPGRPILAENLGPSAVVERNQIVPLIYAAKGLSIRTDGRALARGGAGDFIEVMNLASKSKVTGRVLQDGSIEVGNRTQP